MSDSTGYGTDPTVSGYGSGNSASGYNVVNNSLLTPFRTDNFTNPLQENPYQANPADNAGLDTAANPNPTTGGYQPQRVVPTSGFEL